MRAWGLRVRAGAPRRSQASSRRARLRRTDSAVAARSSRSARGRQVGGVAALVDVGRPRSSSSIRVVTRSRRWRSWVDEDEPAAERSPAAAPARRPRRGRGGWSARRARAARAGAASTRASATRLAWPPESAATSAPAAAPIPSRSRTASASQPSPTASRDRPGRKGRLLVEVADPGAPAAADRPLLGCVHPGDHPEQRRLAGAVDPDHPEPVAVGDGERQVLEQGPVGPAGPDPLEIDEDGHGGSRLPAGAGAPRRDRRTCSPAPAPRT